MVATVSRRDASPIASRRGVSYTLAARRGTTHRPARRMSRRSFNEYLHKFDRWGFDEKGWSRATRDRRLQTWRRAETHFQHYYDKSLIWATLDQLREFHATSPANARTRNNLRAHLVAIFEFLEADGIRENIAYGLPRLREPHNLPKAPDNQTIHKILKTSLTHPPMLASLIHIFAYQGLRLSEARTLEWQMFDHEWLRITGKRERTRIIPVHPETCRQLQRHKTSSPPHPLLYPSPRKPDQPISDTWIKTMIKQVAAEAGIRDFHVHLFRHAYATRLLEQGADLRTVQDLLGHSSPTTTSIYTKIRPHQLNQALHLTYEQIEEEEAGE